MLSPALISLSLSFWLSDWEVYGKHSILSDLQLPVQDHPGPAVSLHQVSLRPAVPGPDDPTAGARSPAGEVCVKGNVCMLWMFLLYLLFKQSEVEEISRCIVSCCFFISLNNFTLIMIPICVILQHRKKLLYGTKQNHTSFVTSINMFNGKRSLNLDDLSLPVVWNRRNQSMLFHSIYTKVSQSDNYTCMFMIHVTHLSFTLIWLLIDRVNVFVAVST